MKFLLWAVIAFVVVLWLLRTKKTAPRPDRGVRKSGRGGEGSAEAMIQCAHCGVHVPVSEAVMSDSGAAFCSQTHRLHFPG